MNSELLVEMVLTTWRKYIDKTSELIQSLTDEELLTEISPGRNSSIYIIGHLIAIHDHMLPILGIGAQMNAGLFEDFVEKADDKSATAYTVTQLKEKWSQQNSLLKTYFSKTTTEEWFEKHMLVSKEDFAIDRKRNRLNVILARIPHLTYHQGQLALLKRKNVD